MTETSHCVWLLGRADDRLDPRAFLDRAYSRGGDDASAWVSPPVRLAGHARWWLSLLDGELLLDGHFAVTSSRRAERMLLRLHPARYLAACPTPIEPVIERLSLFSAATMLLDAVADRSRRRPEEAQSEIERCRRWLDHGLLQYVTGRGALRTVVSPWERYLEDHEALLKSVAQAWTREVTPRLRCLDPDDALAPLLAPLSLVVPDRDLLDILPQYRERLAALGRECNRVSNEVGILGALASLGLVPLSQALGWLFLLPVMASIVIYLFGYRIARWVIGRRVRDDHPVKQGPAGPSSIDQVLTTVLASPCTVLVGDRMSVADVACGFRLWTTLLWSTDLSGSPLRHLTLSSEHGQGESGSPRAAIVLGGPLVRAPLDPRAGPVVPVCELTDAGGDGWHLRADQVTVAADRYETLGWVSTAAERLPLLFVMGFRDTGTIFATDWLVTRIAAAADQGRSRPSDQDQDGWTPTWWILSSTTSMSAVVAGRPRPDSNGRPTA